MVPAQPAPIRRLTYTDYCLIPDDGKKHEIIDGIHYVSSPRYIHQQILFNLSGIFYTWVRENPQGIVLFPFDIRLSEHDIVQPDIVFISNKNRKIIKENHAKGVPDMVIEVLSPGNSEHDWQNKLHLYEHYGVKEYWIIDPDLEEVHQFRLVAGRFRKAHIIKNEEGRSLNSPLLSGFLVPVEKVFRRP